MKHEEAIIAIELIREMKVNVPITQVDITNTEWAKEMAIEALEKQIPKKPERLNAFRSIGKCEGCERVISTRTASAYCQYCGNKVNWGNDDET